LEKLGDEIAMLDIALSGVDQRVGFCHNDLQYGNIMIYEETRQVTLIVSDSVSPFTNAPKSGEQL
jgi:choline/ethanolamine kinase